MGVLKPPMMYCCRLMLICDRVGSALFGGCGGGGGMPRLACDGGRDMTRISKASTRDVSAAFSLAR